jgi:hypothetical protein
LEAAVYKPLSAGLFCLVTAGAITYGLAGAIDENRVLELQLKAARESRVEFAQEALESAEAALEARVLSFYALQLTARNLVEAEVEAAKKPQDEVVAWRKYLETLHKGELLHRAILDHPTTGYEKVGYYTFRQEQERAKMEMLKAEMKCRK